MHACMHTCTPHDSHLCSDLRVFIALAAATDEETRNACLEYFKTEDEDERSIEGIFDDELKEEVDRICVLIIVKKLGEYTEESALEEDEELYLSLKGKSIFKRKFLAVAIRLDERRTLTRAQARLRESLKKPELTSGKNACTRRLVLTLPFSA
jgi:hypothetical protein